MSALVSTLYECIYFAFIVSCTVPLWACGLCHKLGSHRSLAASINRHYSTHKCGHASLFQSFCRIFILPGSHRVASSSFVAHLSIYFYCFQIYVSWGFIDCFCTRWASERVRVKASWKLLSLLSMSCAPGFSFLEGVSVFYVARMCFCFCSVAGTRLATTHIASSLGLWL